jgi:hypothetical protein
VLLHPIGLSPAGVDYTHSELGGCSKPGAPEPCRVAYARDFARDDGQMDDPQVNKVMYLYISRQKGCWLLDA